MPVSVGVACASALSYAVGNRLPSGPMPNPAKVEGQLTAATGELAFGAIVNRPLYIKLLGKFIRWRGELGGFFHENTEKKYRTYHYFYILSTEKILKQV